MTPHQDEPRPEILELDRGTPVPLEVTPYPAADPTAPLHLVVPAMGMRASFYTPLLEALAGSGVHGAVLELRGHQRHLAPPPDRRHDHGYADLVGDLDAAVAVLRARLPGAPVLPLGHSLGGHVVAAHAALHPDAVDGAALVATGSVGWRAWGRTGPWHLLRTQGAGLLTELLGYFPGPRVGFAGREARTQMVEWARWGRTGRLVVGDPPVVVDDHAAQVGLPLLAVLFAGDRLAPSSTTDALVALFPRARLTRRHVAEHAARPHHDWVRRPEVVLPILRAWATGTGQS